MLHNKWKLDASPLKRNGKKRLSSTERALLAKGIDINSPESRAKYEAYKKAGGKLNASQAARVGWKSPEQSGAAMKYANRSSEIGNEAGTGGIPIYEGESPMNRNGKGKFDPKRKAMKKTNSGAKMPKTGPYSKAAMEKRKAMSKKLKSK